MDAKMWERGRGVRLGLALVFFAGCSEGVPGPVAEAVTPHEAAIRETSELGTRVSNSSASEELTVYPGAREYESTLLFLGGRAATPLSTGGSAWADTEGGRVVRFDERGAVDAVLAGAPMGGEPLTQPAFVSSLDGELLASELDGRTLRFAGRDAIGWESSPTTWGGVGGFGLVAASRTVFDIDLQPLSAREPLVRTWDGKTHRAMGRVTMPTQALLGPLVNSGWVATAEDGSVVFASAVRAEVHRYGPDGTLEWISTWEHDGVFEPTFGVTGGTLTPRFRLTQQAVSVGPDGWIYVLATTGSEGPADRLLVFDPGGELVREAPVGTGSAIYVGSAGHVFEADAQLALVQGRTSASRMIFETFDLPGLGGSDSVSLADHEGRVVVVNFWASWCGPCRREMPLLAALANRYSEDEVVVVGLNEDLSPDDALSFLQEIGGVEYRLGEGRGRLREVYGYRGLPYTVVLDREGAVVQALYGFGTSIAPIEEAVARALGTQE